MLQLSPQNIEQLVNDPFGAASPLQLKKIEAADYQKIPMLNSICYLADMMEQQGGLKLTQKGGFLPRKVVRELYDRQFFPKTGRYDITDFKTVLNEYELPAIACTRTLLELAGLARKYRGKLLVTRKWEKIKQDNDKLLPLIFETYTKKLNWAYFDGYRNEDAGQFGFALSLALVDAFGDEPSSSEIYGKTYYRIFPELRAEFGDRSFGDAKTDAYRCYSLRTFERFMKYFGLVKVHRDEADCLKPIDVEKTPFFNKLIACKL